MWFQPIQYLEQHGIYIVSMNEITNKMLQQALSKSDNDMITNYQGLDTI